MRWNFEKIWFKKWDPVSVAWTPSYQTIRTTLLVPCWWHQSHMPVLTHCTRGQKTPEDALWIQESLPSSHCPQVNQATPLPPYTQQPCGSREGKKARRSRNRKGHICSEETKLPRETLQTTGSDRTKIRSLLISPVGRGLIRKSYQ